MSDMEKKFPQPMEDCWECQYYINTGGSHGPRKDCWRCKGEGKYPAKYWCGLCGEPLSYNPANYASRPQDIPNPCTKCFTPTP